MNPRFPKQVFALMEYHGRIALRVAWVDPLLTAETSRGTAYAAVTHDREHGRSRRVRYGFAREVKPNNWEFFREPHEHFCPACWAPVTYSTGRCPKGHFGLELWRLARKKSPYKGEGPEWEEQP